ncbi:MAG: hypothetical protein RIS71_1190, partial [Actinomycetota bacterium]
TYRCAWQHHSARSEPGSRSNDDRLFGLGLEGYGPMNIAVSMILIRDVHVVPGPHIVADIDGQMTDDATSPSDETTIADLHHR